MPLNKYHVLLPASKGGLGAGNPEQETVVESARAPRVFGATITQLDPSTLAYDWRPVAAAPAPAPESPAAETPAPENEVK